MPSEFWKANLPLLGSWTIETWLACARRVEYWFPFNRERRSRVEDVTQELLSYLHEMPRSEFEHLCDLPEGEIERWLRKRSLWIDRRFDPQFQPRHALRQIVRNVLADRGAAQIGAAYGGSPSSLRVDGRFSTELVRQALSGMAAESSALSAAEIVSALMSQYAFELDPRHASGDNDREPGEELVQFAADAELLSREASNVLTPMQRCALALWLVGGSCARVGPALGVKRSRAHEIVQGAIRALQARVRWAAYPTRTRDLAVLLLEARLVAADRP